MSCAVSVIIPVYNAEKYLRQCLDSVINQTLSDIEIICIDDGSKDSSGQTLHEYSKNDQRVLVVSQTNKGAGEARNTGINVSNGKYLLFLDADDWLENDVLECAVTEIEKYKSDFVMFDAECFDDKSGKKLYSDWIVKTELLPDKQTFNAMDIPKHIFTFSYNIVWNKLFKRDFIIESGLKFLQHPNSQDAYFVCMSLALANSIRFIDKKLIHYRRNVTESISSGLFTNSGITNLIDVLNHLSTELKILESYDSLRQSFFNYSTSLLLWALNKSEISVYNVMFNEVRDKWFEQNELIPELYFYQHGDYLQYKSIMKNEPNEHLKTLLTFKGTEFIDICGYLEYNHIIGDNVALYGAGEIGRDFYRKLKRSNSYEVVIWVDTNYMNLQGYGIPASDIAKLNSVDFDIIIIAIFDIRVTMEIMEDLIKMGIPQKKIICPYSDIERYSSFLEYMI